MPPTLHPVAEAYHFRDLPPPWAWSMAEHEPGTYHHMNLSGEITLAEVGSLVASEVHQAQLEQGPSATEWLDALVGYAPFSVRGGVVVSDGEREIRPECCCSVGGWKEWQRFAAGGASPWMGHDPFAWAEWEGDTARVWSDGLYDKSAQRFAIDFTRERFESELAGVERKLLGFLDRVKEWAASVGYRNPAAVRQAFAVSVLDAPKE